VCKWFCLLEASTKSERTRPVLVRPMFGKGGVGAPVEVVDVDQLGLRKYNKAIANLVYDEEKTAVTKQNSVAGDKEITVGTVGDYTLDSFKIDDVIKIKGSAIEPQAFHKIERIEVINKSSDHKALESKFTLSGNLQSDFATGAEVIVIISSSDLEDQVKRDQKIKDELDYIAQRRLGVSDEEYGLRFLAGDKTLKLDAKKACEYDIPQLLALFPDFAVKIEGYTGEKSTNDVYREDDDLKYLAYKRCQTAKELIESKAKHLLELGATLSIGIEAKGFVPGIPSCCLVKQSTVDDNIDLAEIEKRDIRDMREKAIDKRFFVQAKQASDNNRGTDGNTLSSRGSRDNIIATEGRVVRLLDVKLQDNNASPREEFKASPNQSRDSEALSIADEEMMLFVDKKQDNLLFYWPDQELEFFSKTHRKWLHVVVTRVAVDEGVEDLMVHRWTEKGVTWAGEKNIEGAALGEIISGDQVSKIKLHGRQMSDHELFKFYAPCFYDVMFTRSKNHRTMVEVDSLRRPLYPVEAGHPVEVEVFSVQDGKGKWLRGTIREPQPSGTYLGYNVEVEMKDGTEPEKMSCVPAERLRRRFKEDTTVWFYHSPKEGWKEAKVHGNATDLPWVSVEKTDVLTTKGDNRPVDATLPKLTVQGAQKPVSDPENQEIKEVGRAEEQVVKVDNSPMVEVTMDFQGHIGAQFDKSGTVLKVDTKNTQRVEVGMRFMELIPVKDDIDQQPIKFSNDKLSELAANNKSYKVKLQKKADIEPWTEVPIFVDGKVVKIPLWNLRTKEELELKPQRKS